MKLRPNAILFDMDGVLVNSLDAWWSTLNTALNLSHQKEISREEFIKKYWGHDLFDNLDHMRLPHEIGTLCNTIYGNHVEAIKIYPDTIETLEKLSRYKKGVITNTPKDSAHLILKTLDLASYFDVVITSDEVTMAKPNPEIVFKACGKLGVSPKKVVLIGDTDSDVKAGEAAGCIVVGIKVNAEYTIQRLSELITILQE